MSELRFTEPLVRGALALGALAALLVPTPAVASPQGPDFRFSAPRISFGLRAGWTFNRGDSDIYPFFTELLTLEDSDFNRPHVGFDLGLRVNDRVDAVLGIEYGRRARTSEYRDFVTFDDLPIPQATRLAQTDVTLGLRLYLTSRGRRVSQYAWVPSAVVPYVGGGGGLTYYKLEQFGEFVDFRDLVIFEDNFFSDGWTVAAHAYGGVEIKLNPSLALTLEGRYHWASAELGESFLGFDPIDLTGARATIGVSWKQ